MPVLLLDNQLYDTAVWMAAGAIAILSFHWLKRLIGVVLTDLYYWLIQKGFFPV